MASAIGKVRAVFTASTSGLTAGVNQASASMKRLQKDVGSLRGGLSTLTAISGAQLFGSIASGALAAGRSIAGLGRDAFSALSSAVEAATNLGEETSKSGVIFGQSAAAVAEFARSASQIGLSQTAALQATGSFGNLFTAMGLGQEQAASYATTLTSLGADLASFNNATVEDAVGALGAALRGEAEPIRRFGVLLDEATLKQAALDKGLIDSTKSALTPAIKAQAAYAAILEQTASAQGDFQRTSGSLANLGRIVSAQTSNIFADIGQAFEPLFRSATSAFSKILDAVRPFVQSVAEGVRGSIEVIAAAINNLVPAFTAFLGGLDGGAIGERIGQGILSGARYLAQIADWFVANLGPLWEYASRVGGQWNAVWEFGSRVVSFFAGIGDSLQAAFGILILGISGPVEGLIFAAQQIGQTLGFDTTGLDQALASMDAFNVTIADGITENVNAAAENFNRAIFGDDEASKAGEAIARPFSKALADAEARALDAMNQIDQAQQQTLKVQSPATAGIAEAVKTAIQGIDSRTTEGMKEYFRILRGDGGENIPAQQLNELRGIRDAVEEDGIEFDTFDLAPAAGV